MLVPAVRRGASAVRRAGWPAYAVALVVGLPDLLPSSALAAPVEVAVFPVVGLLRTIAFLGLIRLLGANRDSPVPPPPAVDATGVRVVIKSVIPPVAEDDRSVRLAMQRAARLGRPALRLFALSLLAGAAAVAVWAGLVGASGIDLDEVGSRDAVGVVPIALLSALLLSFIAVADQRVALEGDPRVLLAAAHSVRIAGVTFAAIYALVLLAIAPGAIGALLPHGIDGLPWQVLRMVVGAGIQLVVLAALTEVYLAGPRADLLVDTPRQP